MELTPGVIIGDNYRLESLVGAGGMGAVWKATDVSLGRTVALKVLHTNLRDSPSLTARFQREAQLLASLDHPAIVPVYAWLTIEDDGGQTFPCIVMPFVRGTPLGDMMAAQQGPLPIDRAVGLIRALLDALSVAHAAGIVHRDLKPQNVILEDRGGRVQVRLLDFGIAKSLAANAQTAPGGPPGATQAGMLLGTPAYMSPEQITDPANVDARADLWAVGVVLYEMLTTQTPFPGATPFETVSRVLTHPPQQAAALNRALPPPVDQFFARVFTRDPAQRPRDAAEMITLVDALAAATAPGTVAAPAGLPSAGAASHATGNTHGYASPPSAASYATQATPYSAGVPGPATGAGGYQATLASASPLVATHPPATGAHLFGDPLKPESGLVVAGPASVQVQQTTGYGALPSMAQAGSPAAGTAISGKKMAGIVVAIFAALGLGFVGVLALVVVLVFKAC
jgi:serine/threonine protein kinase